MALVTDPATTTVPPSRSPLQGDHPGFTEAREAAAALARATGAALEGPDSHRIAVVLGSGWGGAAELIGETEHTVPTSELPGFAAPSVPGHNPTVRSVRLADGSRALVFGSRTHYYEHRDAGAVAHTVRTAAAAGARAVVLTNGCGSLVPEWGPGTPVLIADHLNLTGATPLVGAEFVDLTDLYSPRIREIARSVDPDLPEGVYVQFPGPQYETPAEVRYAKAIGGDLVGMSTALDAIAARHAGLEVFGISLVTNAAAGFSGEPLSHDEVVQAGRDAGPRISALLAGIIGRL
ncbi:purine-nucleoside phosphorylase [Citricoccus sp. SGAir0253]|uniref:purine-nucleoside phosphorylase n=1 Tax=Citricoccus sp. SGAir0253 TaxID=2567881 RepID=UPI0010CD5287|nr:purine-nucleoside phosphorylase [Citricoccus sp. SGAir0253]